MNQNLLRWMTFLVAIAALAGFIVVYFVLLTKGLEEGESPLAYLASTLSGLVGGIVAAAFGQKLPNPPAGTRLSQKLNASGRFLTPFDSEKLREYLIAAYALAYLAMSGWAVWEWVANSSSPELVNHLAVVSIGLFIAIVAAYLSDPAPHVPTQSGGG